MEFTLIATDKRDSSQSVLASHMSYAQAVDIMNAHRAIASEHRYTVRNIQQLPPYTHTGFECGAL